MELCHHTSCQSISVQVIIAKCLRATCDEQQPHLLVNIETTPATTPDDNMLEPVHASLKVRDLLPAAHLVDQGYTDAHVLVHSQRQHGVTLVGPGAEDPSWQVRSGGFDQGSFIVDWERRLVSYPAGKQRISWLPTASCRTGWFRGAIRPERLRGVSRPRARHQQVEAGAAHQRVTGTGVARGAAHRAPAAETTECRSQYAARAGSERTHQQALRRCGLRPCRYLGQAKVRLPHVLTATALNLVRLNDWWAARPHANTRVSHFATLTQAA
jgi:transposase